MASIKNMMLVIIGAPVLVWGIMIIVQLFMRMYREFKLTFENLLNKNVKQHMGDGACSAALFVMIWLIMITVISILTAVFNIYLSAGVLKSAVNIAMIILAAYILTLAVWRKKLKYAAGFFAVHEVLRNVLWYIL